MSTAKGPDALANADALADALFSDVDRAVGLAGDLNRASADRVADRASSLLSDLVHAHSAALDLTDARWRSRSRARDLARDLNRARNRAAALARARALGRGLAHDLARDLVRALASAFGAAAALARALNLSRAHGRASTDARANGSGQPGARQVASSAASLLTTAARLLPAVHRCRYAEEYRSELWELAQAGASQVKQLRYALCQLRSALSMSVALRSPQRRSSVP